MIRREGQVLDEFGRPVPGASIYVFNDDGTNASITSDGTTPIPLGQSLTTDEFGIYSYYAIPALYREDTYFGGRLRYREILSVGLDGIYPTSRAGSFLAFDADGNPVASSGTGADAGLRTDLAADTGGSLIAYIATGVGAIKRSVVDKLLERTSVMDYGADGGGETDDTDAIVAALTYASSIGGGVVDVPANCTCLHGAFTIPDGVSLHVYGTLIPTGDIDLISVGQNSGLIGLGKGKMDLTGLTAFTHSATIINSTTTDWLASGSVIDIDIINNPTAPGGQSTEFRVAGTDQHRISFCTIDGNRQNFEKVVWVNIADPGTGKQNWCNSNTVRGLFTNVGYGVHADAPAALTRSFVDNWRFDFQLQTGDYDLKRALLWGGRWAEGVISAWDVDATTSTDNIVAEFTDTSQRNRINFPLSAMSQIINRFSSSGTANRINTQSTPDESLSQESVPPLSTMTPVAAPGDDYLAYATTRSGWAVTSSVAPDSGSLASVFNPLGNSFAEWLAAGVVDIKIDLGASIGGCALIGAIFDIGSDPSTFTIKTSVDDVTYTTVKDGTASSILNYWKPTSPAAAFRYIKVSFDGAGSDVALFRIFAPFTNSRGNVYGERYQPNFESQLSINGTKVLGPRVTGFTADTGTAEKTAHATYAAGTTLTFSATYTQAELTALATRLAAVEAALQSTTRGQKALKDALIAHGIVGT